MYKENLVTREHMGKNEIWLEKEKMKRNAGTTRLIEMIVSSV